MSTLSNQTILTASITLIGLLLVALSTTSIMTTGATAEERFKKASVDYPDMSLIPGGFYRPLYLTATEKDSTKVTPFYLDTYPVTNKDFLDFVQANPEWQRSQVSPLFADENYLEHWHGDLDFGSDSLANSPVVNVSWFAAMAFAEWKSKRLPTTSEWELAAAASKTRPDGKNDPLFRERIINWYSSKAPRSLPSVGSTYQNLWGVYDLHGLVWEWVLDFNTSFVTGESRNNADLDLKLFCGSGSVGASQFEDYTAFVRFAYRSGLEGNYTVSNLGFRCARDA